MFIVLRVPFPILGGLLALTVSFNAEAAFTSKYVDSSHAFTDTGPFSEWSDKLAGREDLGEVQDEDNIQIGPNGGNTSFATVGDTVNLLGALDVGDDPFEIVMMTPGLRIELKDLIFADDPGKLQVSIGLENGSILNNDFSPTNDAPIVLDVYSGVTSIAFDNVDNDNAIGYEVELVATPLPGAMVLFGTGLAGIAGYRRWFKNAA